VVNVGSERRSTTAGPTSDELLEAQLKAIHKLLVDVAGEVTAQRYQLTALQSGQYHLGRAIEKVQKQVRIPAPGRGPRRHNLEVEAVLVPLPDHMRREAG
jgi:hypothetical protein